MKVTIKDREFLERITPEQLTNYLNENGFNFKFDRVEDDEVIGKVYASYNSELHTEVFVEVLNDETRIDYIASITTALMYLEKATGQSQLQIYVDITGDEVFFIPKQTEDQINEYIKDMIE
jgi:hypothetical protein